MLDVRPGAAPAIWLDPGSVRCLPGHGGVGATTIAKYVGHIRSLHHERFGVVFLSGLVQVERVLEGLVNRERALPHRISGRKAPFTWGMFQRVAPGLLASSSLADLELVTVMAVGIAFLLRASELLSDGVTDHFLRRQDVIFGPISDGAPAWVTVNIRSSKMHKTRKHCSLARTSDPIGVVRILWSWHSRTGGYSSPSNPLFPTLKRSPLSLRLRELAATLCLGHPRWMLFD
jgi:hypothetical protein